ncbi:hypothetical protein KIN20_002587 [Parelaphostrongylus tenuis]|uniref:Uncharacterized protein n=1 Tax=Parelaphostrongylus tenuis TaxID=148309 RepID=A0AAD5QFG4_PARTN|nr:hypothetical protein KIN20_002587 [Parelaphostrongylus tenuis]
MQVLNVEEDTLGKQRTTRSHGRDGEVGNKPVVAGPASAAASPARAASCSPRRIFSNVPYSSTIILRGQLRVQVRFQTIRPEILRAAAAALHYCGKMESREVEDEYLTAAAAALHYCGKMEI